MPHSHCWPSTVHATNIVPQDSIIQFRYFRGHTGAKSIFLYFIQFITLLFRSFPKLEYYRDLVSHIPVIIIIQPQRVIEIILLVLKTVQEIANVKILL
jgi:hypothetical protein